MTQGKLVVLNPTAGFTMAAVAPRPRLDTLNGKTLGVLWNGKIVTDKILERMVGILREKYDIKDVVFLRKPYFGNVAPQAILDEIVTKCDVVITGVGD